MKFSLSNRKTNLLSLMSFTNKLILTNVILFLTSLFVIAIYTPEFFAKTFALTPSIISSGQGLWTFVTSMFLHAGFFHLFANMFSLFFIGSFL